MGMYERVDTINTRVRLTHRLSESPRKRRCRPSRHCTVSAWPCTPLVGTKVHYLSDWPTCKVRPGFPRRSLARTHLRALERPHTARRMARAQSPRHRVLVPRDPRRGRAQQRVVAGRQRPAAAGAALWSRGLLLVYMTYGGRARLSIKPIHLRRFIANPIAYQVLPHAPFPPCTTATCRTRTGARWRPAARRGRPSGPEWRRRWAWG